MLKLKNKRKGNQILKRNRLKSVYLMDFVQIIEGINKETKIKGNIIKEDIIKGDLPK